MATLNWKTPNGTTGSIDMNTIVTTDTNQEINSVKTFKSFIAFNRTYDNEKGRIQLESNDGYLGLYGSSSYTEGAAITIYGKNSAQYAGGFIISTNDGTNNPVFAGFPDGTLKWNNSNVLTKLDVKTGSTNGTINIHNTDVAVKGLASGAYAAAYTHPTTAGNKHIPTGGSTGQVLKYGGSSGTASWATLTASDVGALATSGGTITGTLTLKTDSNNNALIKNGGTDGMIQLSADAGGTSKGLLRLYGSTYSTSNLRGGFSIGCDGAMLQSYPGLHSNLMWNNTAVSLDGHTHSEYVYTAGNGLSLSSKSFSVNASLAHAMNATKGTNPSTNIYHEHISYDNSGNGSGVKYRYASIGRRLQTDGTTVAYIQAYDSTANSTNNSMVAILYPKGGTPYTSAPNPPDEDSSTKIATTSWVGKYGGVTSFSSMNYIVFKSGLKIMMGKHACSTSGFTNVTFPISFTNTPDIVCTIKAEAENTVYNTAKMYNPSNTGFSVASVEGSAYSNRTVHWIAIGV